MGDSGRAVALRRRWAGSSPTRASRAFRASNGSDLDGLTHRDRLRAVFRYFDGQNRRRRIDARGARLGPRAGVRSASVRRRFWRSSRAEHDALHGPLPRTKRRGAAPAPRRCLVQRLGPVDQRRPGAHPSRGRTASRTSISSLARTWSTRASLKSAHLLHRSPQRSARRVRHAVEGSGSWSGRPKRCTTAPPRTCARYPQELEYLAGILDHYFPGKRGPQTDAFAGLRVLPRGAARPSTARAT